MLLSAKILKDINGLNTSRPGKNWFVGFGAVLLISFIFLSFLNEKFAFGIFSNNQTLSDPSVTASAQNKMSKQDTRGLFLLKANQR